MKESTTITFTPHLEQTLENYRVQLEAPSKIATLLRAVTLLGIVLDASEGADAVLISDENNTPKIRVTLREE